MADLFLLDNAEPVSAAGFFGAALLTVVDVSLNLVVSSVLEAIFPPYESDTTKKSVWMGALEATIEIILHVMATNVLLYWSSGFFGTAGTLVPFGALVGIFLLTSARTKLVALQRHLIHRTKLSKDTVSVDQPPK